MNMMRYEIVPDGDRQLVVRITPQGVATVETDCPGPASARVEKGRLDRAELARVQLYTTVTDRENALAVERVRQQRQLGLFP